MLTRCEGSKLRNNAGVRICVHAAGSSAEGPFKGRQCRCTNRSSGSERRSFAGPAVHCRYGGYGGYEGKAVLILRGVMHGNLGIHNLSVRLTVAPLVKEVLLLVENIP